MDKHQNEFSDSMTSQIATWCNSEKIEEEEEEKEEDEETSRFNSDRYGHT